MVLSPPTSAGRLPPTVDLNLWQFAGATLVYQSQGGRGRGELSVAGYNSTWMSPATQPSTPTYLSTTQPTKRGLRASSLGWGPGILRNTGPPPRVSGHIAWFLLLPQPHTPGSWHHMNSIWCLVLMCKVQEHLAQHWAAFEGQWAASHAGSPSAPCTLHYLCATPGVNPGGGGDPSVLDANYPPN